MFKLYADEQNIPRMCTYVCDWFVPRERIKALAMMAKAYAKIGEKSKLRFVSCSYRPNIAVAYVAKTLGFKSQDACLNWLRKLQMPLVQVGMRPADSLMSFYNVL